MSGASDLPIHGRNHRTGGSDPIPGAGGGTPAPPPPSVGIPALPGLAHWWRMRELIPTEAAPPAVQPIYTPDEVTGDDQYLMRFIWQDDRTIAHIDEPTTEVVGPFGAGAPPPVPDPPSSDALILRRDGPQGVVDLDSPPHPPHTARNPDNFFSGHADTVGVDWGNGGEWTIIGWFWIEGTGDIINVDRITGTQNTCLALDLATNNVVLYRDGSSFLSPHTVLPDTWQFLAVTLGADNRLKVYANPGSIPTPIIDEADPATVSYSNVLAGVGAPNDYPDSTSGLGSFSGFFTEVAVYDNALSADDLRSLYLGGKYGAAGTVPPYEDIPAGAIAPSQIAPGENGQHLVTEDGTAQWADDTGGGEGPPGPEGPEGPTGPEGPQGDPGEGVPAGGTSGQVLTKDSGTDFDSSWQDPTGGGGGAADVQSFSADGTWSKPAGVEAVRVIVIGAGGGGGAGATSGGAAARSGGKGGAGGACWEETFRADDLTGTVAVTVAGGGAGGTPTGTFGNPGGNGGMSSFGAYATAGGGAGGGAASSGAAAGGGGGTYLATGSGTTGAEPNNATGNGLGNQSARGNTAGGPGASTEYGGAAGGGGLITTAAAGAGGSSSRGGAGGGGGGGHTATPAVGSPGAGGLAGGYANPGGGGGAGTSGASPTPGGNGGTVTGRLCGSGGGGGGSTVAAATAGRNGGGGGIGAGGGGGGCSSGASGGSGGAGGNGLVIVIAW